MKSSIYYSLVLIAFHFFAMQPITAQAPTWAWAQAFGSEQGGNFGRAITVNPVNGDVYTTGSLSDTTVFDPAGNMHVLNSSRENSFITKMDRNGNLLWAKSLEGGLNFSTSIIYNSDDNGSIYMLGYFTDTVDFDPGPGVFGLNSENETESTYLLKLDANGHFIWAKEFSSDLSAVGRSIEVITSGNEQGIYIVGSFTGSIDADPGNPSHLLNASTLYDSDAFAIKLKLNGQFAWAKKFGSSKQEECFDIASDAKGDLYIAGTFRDTVDFDPEGGGDHKHIASGNKDVFILKLTSDGDMVWSKTWGGSSVDQSNAITIDKFGNSGLYVTGYFTGTSDFDPDPLSTFYTTSIGDQDMFISRLDFGGQHLWTKTFGGLMLDRGWDLINDPCGNGDVIITGQWEDEVDFDPGPGMFQVTVDDNATCIFVIAFDKSGNFKWVKPVGNGNGDSSQGIDMDYAGNIYIAGSILSDEIYFDTILVGASTPKQNGHEILTARIGLQDNSPISHLDSLSIFPIPVISELTIDFKEVCYLDVNILLYTILGQLIISNDHEMLSGKTYLDLSYLPASTYILEIRYNGKKRVEKIVKL